jgi:RimJ/RimL family protein N-acetyltransferase
MSATPKIALGAFREADRERLFTWINDQELVRFSAAFRPISKAEHDAWFDSLGGDPTKVIFAIRDLESQDLIGSVQIIHLSQVHRNGEMVIRIGDSRFRGRGYGPTALRSLLDYAWNNLKLHRLSARVFKSNVRAIAAYKKVGFIEEGLLREDAFVEGQWEDVVLMGVLNNSDG